MSDQQLFISSRTFQLVLPGTGITARFEAGVPRPLRASMHEQAQREGVLPSNPQIEAAIQSTIQTQVAAAAQASVDAEAADAAMAAEAATELTLSEVIAKMVKEGNPEYFDTSGKPRVREIEKLLGQKINMADRDEAWSQYEAIE